MLELVRLRINRVDDTSAYAAAIRRYLLEGTPLTRQLSCVDSGTRPHGGFALSASLRS
jgi:hypothetical protein